MSSSGSSTIALIVWEVVQIVDVKVPDLPVKAALLTAGLAAGILLFTVIKFLVDNEFRHWPAWIGLILAIVIAGRRLAALVGGCAERDEPTASAAARGLAAAGAPPAAAGAPELDGVEAPSGASASSASSRKKSPQTVAQSSPWPRAPVAAVEEDAVAVARGSGTA